MKCSACANNECEGKYENRHKCTGEKEGIECSCYCKRTKGEVFFSSLLSIGTGVAVAAAGIGLTVATGGIAAVIGGAAIAGGGTSLVISPIQKLVTKDCVTFEDSVKEVALGATIGAVTGPIGALGSTASKGATVAVKIGARMVAGSAAGATSGVICEGAKALKGEEVTWESLGKSVAIGAVAGTVGGASTSLAHSSVCKPVADVIGRPAMRVITQAGTSMATDAGVQLATTGEINPKLLVANATGQVVCGVTAEAVSSMASSGQQDKKQIKEASKPDRPDKPDNRPDNQPDHKPEKQNTMQVKEQVNNGRPPTPDSQPDNRFDHKPIKNTDNFDFVDKKQAQQNSIDFNKLMNSEFTSDSLSNGQEAQKYNQLNNERPNQPNILDQKPFQQSNIDKINNGYELRDGFSSRTMRRMHRIERNRVFAENILKIVEYAVPKETIASTVPTNNLVINQLNHIYDPTKNKNQDVSTYSPEKLLCLVDLLDSRKSYNKDTTSRESVARALEILRNTNDPELYGILVQYNIPLDTIGIEATRLMLEQTFEVNINIEVTFNDRTYVFGSFEGQDTIIIQLDLINGHFINELQDGASAGYYDCLYYAIAEHFPDILLMTPDELRRNISDIIKTNGKIRSNIINRVHKYFIDLGFFGGREAKRESEDEEKDLEEFLKRILKLLRNPQGRNHSYNAIDQDFPNRFDILYQVPLEIDHVLPVNVWVTLFKSLKKSKNPRLLRMLQILTGLADPTKMTVEEFKALVKKIFPCLILPGLVHRNLLTTCFSFTTMGFCGLLAYYVEDGNFEEAIKMIFQDQHNTTISIREQFPNVLFPQTLAEELDILHTWQRSLVNYFLDKTIINVPQACLLLEIIDQFPIEAYDYNFWLTWNRFMNFPTRYIDMYIDRDFIISDDEEDEDDEKSSINKKTN